MFSSPFVFFAICFPHLFIVVAINSRHRVWRYYGI
ncbi:hypothetical protein VPHD479_0404 [Vibrio phage D479]